MNLILYHSTDGGGNSGISFNPACKLYMINSTDGGENLGIGFSMRPGDILILEQMGLLPIRIRGRLLEGDFKS